MELQTAEGSVIIVVLVTVEFEGYGVGWRVLDKEQN